MGKMISTDTFLRSFANDKASCVGIRNERNDIIKYIFKFNNNTQNQLPLDRFLTFIQDTFDGPAGLPWKQMAWNPHKQSPKKQSNLLSFLGEDSDNAGLFKYDHSDLEYKFGRRTKSTHGL